VRYTPNLLTIIRLLLIVPINWSLLHTEYGLAFSLFLTASFSDALDGWLARTFSWHSKLGAFFDPLADKLLITITLVVLAWMLHIPLWLVAITLTRDFFIFMGFLIHYIQTRSYEINVLWSSKLYIIVLLSTMTLLLLSLSRIPFIDMEISQIINAGFWLTGLLAIVSGLHYLLIWIPKFNKNSPPPEKKIIQETNCL